MWPYWFIVISLNRQIFCPIKSKFPSRNAISSQLIFSTMSTLHCCKTIPLQNLQMKNTDCRNKVGKVVKNINYAKSRKKYI